MNNELDHTKTAKNIVRAQSQFVRSRGASNKLPPTLTLAHWTHFYLYYICTYILYIGDENALLKSSISIGRAQCHSHTRKYMYIRHCAFVRHSPHDV